jgi:hypothetical protein
MEKYPKLECHHFSDFKNKDCINGVLTLRLTSWDEFHNVLKIFKNYTYYLWRGERCYCEKWPLKSSFDRHCDRKFSNSKERQDELAKILDKFKEKLRALPHTEIKCLTDDEIWAIGQHYGLPTPLLDWTECPYFAAYFAFYKKGTNEQTENRVIYALNKGVKLLKSVRKKERFVDFPNLEHNLGEMQNERLKEQKGKFTKALNGDDIKVNVERISKKGKYNQKIFLAEILIPDKFRYECLRFLESKKITHGALFPDYAGAVDICKIELGIDKS